ncbi:MAG: cytochrome bd ubiquinol oxidase, subunit, partial [Parcubacteria group bacterium]|nr:cytochrome bd ubiquinol oxidase, subunit [Parcubacteria group bacterium]
EAMWLKTKEDKYYRQLRFWTKVFILTFAIGTATGFPLEFEFGTNWAKFSTAAGDFFGNILGFESTVAFALEAAFLGIFVFGWNKVNKWMHFFANLMIFVGATLSAFWIMAANSWMQVPIGVQVVDGKLLVTDYLVAIFNPDTMVSFLHMWVACVESTLFMMLGICACVLLSRKASQPVREFFLATFKYCLALAIVVTPLQIGLGDLSGLTIGHYQPAKLAATELHWDTNAPGVGASWALLAWPNAEGTGNAFEVKVPNVLSILSTHTLTGQVQGLNDFNANDRPSLINDITVFYSFRTMVACGMIMFLLMLLGVFYWKKGLLSVMRVGKDRLFWWLFVLATPLGFIATEAGWMVREIGRQPWVVYHLLRTKEGLSPGLSTHAVAATTGIFTLIYIVFGALFVYFLWKIVVKGPDLTSDI